MRPYRFIGLFLPLFLAWFTPAVAGQQVIRVYPSTLTIEKGGSATFTAVAFDANGNYLPNRKFEFAQLAGRDGIATVRSSPEGDTEGPNSRYSNNLAEVSAISAGTVQFVAKLNGIESPPVIVTVVDPDAAPFAVISGETDGGVETIRVRVGEAVEVSAENSTGIKQVEWLWGDGDRSSQVLSATHAYLYAGSYTLRLRVINSFGAVSEAEANVVVSDHPPPTRTFNVASMAGLLAAYLQCTGGEHIVIQAGSVLTGSVELPARAFSDFVTIRSSAASPDMAVRAGRGGPFATLRAEHPGDIPLVIKNRASKIRLSGLKFDAFHGSNDTIRNYYLLQIGEAFGQNTVADNPSRIIVDHCVIDPPNNIQVVHGILNDGYKVSIMSSWLGNIRTYGGQDSQAVFSLDGRGAHVYNNTYFEAASESIIYGGANNMIDGHVPKNVEFRRCVFTKPVAWRSLPPNSVGDTINIKNLFETKNVRRVYVEGSVLKNQWDAERSQYQAIVIKSTADRPGGDQGSPWSVSEEIVFENVRVSHINGGVAVGREFERPGMRYDPLKPRDIRFVNVLFDDLTFGRWGDTRSWAFHLSGVDDFSLKNVTVVDAIDTPDNESEMLLSLGSINSYRLEVLDSILPLNYYGIRNTCGEGRFALDVSTSGWFNPITGNSCVAGASAGAWRVEGNVMPRLRSPDVGQNYPVGNQYPQNFAAIRMNGYRNCHGSYLIDNCESLVDDLALGPDSPYRNAATGGGMPGIDAELLARRLRCTISGDSRSCVNTGSQASPTPTPVPLGIEADLSPRSTGDGLLSPADLMTVRQMVAGMITPEAGSNEFQRADTAPIATRGDGVLSAADITQARRYVLSIDPPSVASGPHTAAVSTIESFSGVAGLDIELIKNDDSLHVQAPSAMSAVSFTLEVTPGCQPRMALADGLPFQTVLTVNADSDGVFGIVIDSPQEFGGSGIPILEVAFSEKLTRCAGSGAVSSRLLQIGSWDAEGRPAGLASTH